MREAIKVQIANVNPGQAEEGDIIAKAKIMREVKDEIENSKLNDKVGSDRAKSIQDLI